MWISFLGTLLSIDLELHSFNLTAEKHNILKSYRVAVMKLSIERPLHPGKLAATPLAKETKIITIN
jgi:hypothetical protein